MVLIHPLVARLYIVILFSLSIVWQSVHAQALKSDTPKNLESRNHPTERPLTGYPILTSYERNVYKGRPQNWSMVQNQSGLIYIGNGDGVLEYDGVNWLPIPTKRNTTVRSMALSKNDVIYVGGVGEFGMLANNGTGKPHFISLSEGNVTTPFADIWNTLATEEGVFFQSREAIFRLHSGEITTILPENTRFHRMYNVGGRLIVHTEREGLMELRGTRLFPIPGGEQFIGPSRLSIVEQPNGDWLIAWWDKGLYSYNGRTFTAEQSAIDDIIKTVPVYQMLALGNERYALATIGKGLFILDAHLNLLMKADKRVGLLNDTVLSLFQDQQGSLWALLNDGFSRIEVNIPFTFWDDRQGLEGSVLDILRSKHGLFISTTNGVYKMRDTPSHQVEFSRVPGINVQAWRMIEIEGDLYAISITGFHKYENGAFVTLHRLIGLSLHRSQLDPDLLFVGVSDGLVAFRKTGNQWRYLGDIGQLKAEIRSIEEYKAGELWLGSLYQGIIRIKYANISGHLSLDQVVIDTFNESHGLGSTSGAAPHALPQALVFSSTSGVQRFDTQTQQFVQSEPFSTLSLSSTEIINILKYDVQTSTYWVNTLSRLLQGTISSSGLIEWNNHPFSQIVRHQPFDVLYHDKSGEVLIGGSDGVIIYNPVAVKPSQVAFNAMIRNVKSSLDSTLIHGAIMQHVEKRAFDFTHRNLRFEYAAPGRFQDDQLQFRFKLEGYDKEWSTWSASTFKEYTNLFEGEYTFNVLARDMYGLESAQASLQFSIAPPPFRTLPAYLAYVFLGFSSVYLFIFIRTRSYTQRNQILEQKVAARTKALSEQKVQLEEANKRQAHLMNIVAHDMKNPLGIIQGYADIMLSEGKLDEENKAFMLRINDITQKMYATVNDLLSTRSRNGKNGLDGVQVRVDLVQELNQLLDNAGVMFQHKDQRIHKSFPHEAPVMADKVRLTNIVENLLSNACKFSKINGDIYLSVRRLAPEQTDGKERVRCSIQDNGPGFTPIDLKMLFTPYQQLSAKPTGGEESTGLGLSIVKELAEATGALISVECPKEGGAIFHVDFLAASEA